MASIENKLIILYDKYLSYNYKIFMVNLDDAIGT